MDDRFENVDDTDDEWFSDIELRALDLEQELSEWRESRARELAETARRREDEREFAESSHRRAGASRHAEGGGVRQREFLRAVGNPDPDYDDGRRPAGRTGSRSASRHAWPAEEERRPAGERTQVLIDRGRRTVRQPRSRRGRKIVIATAVAVAGVIAVVLIVFRSGPSWPASVATVQSQITTACQNPNLASEPGQVNFACGRDTSQILWVFSLMTSGNNPNYSDPKTGRKGLEPITPAQGGQIAWSLNLHHPYNPLNPVDSLAVAARAINNIIGGATLTGATGKPAVQPGLESSPANCARYTGSSAIISHAGFPSLCAEPVTSPEGLGALVADVYRQWMVGAGPVAAQNVSVLFQNAKNPGDPQVQAILKTLPDHGR